MKTGFCGAFVISWSQTELDGLQDAPVAMLAKGAAWSWRGTTLRVDGPADILRLERSSDATVLRQRAARMVSRLVGTAFATEEHPAEWDPRSVPLVDTGFIVSDGRQQYTVTLIDTGRGGAPLLLFVDEIPPTDREMWVVETFLPRDTVGPHVPENAGVICFTPGTMISTPIGARAVETLREGDLVSTLDSGAQEIRWIGRKRMTGARFFAMPHLRPVRVRAGALAPECPDAELLVSPEHMFLIEGAAALDLFHEREVLVAARDLVDDETICIEHRPGTLDYVHLMLPRHEVLWANNVPTESFHPARADLQAMSDEDRARLAEMDAEMLERPERYGHAARRVLTRSEAAILKFAA